MRGSEVAGSIAGVVEVELLAGENPAAASSVLHETAATSGAIIFRRRW